MKKLILMCLVCLSFSVFAQDDSYEQPYEEQSHEEPFKEEQPQLDRSPDSEDPYAEEPAEEAYEENY